VPLSVDVLDILHSHRLRQEAESNHWSKHDGPLTKNGFIFTTGVGTPVHPRNFEREFKRIIARANKDVPEGGAPKVTSIRFHDLRYLHVSMLVAKGLDPRSIADRVGHTNPPFTLDVYSHFFEGRRQRQSIGISDLVPVSKDVN
jgi:integrase